MQKALKENKLLRNVLKQNLNVWKITFMKNSESLLVIEEINRAKVFVIEKISYLKLNK